MINKLWSGIFKYITLTVVCFITGVLLVLSIQLTLSNNSTQSTDTKNETLVEIIDTLEVEAAELQAQIDALKITMTEAIDLGGNDPAVISSLQTQLSNLQFQYFQTEVTGQGIIITIDDNSAGAELKQTTDPTNYNPNNYLIHDTDLRYLLNEIVYLAEAVSINGQRIVNTTNIRCVGTVIMVNSVRLAPPYEISIIGSSALLEAALNESAQYNYLKNSNFPITVTKETDIIIPAYTGTFVSYYANIYDSELAAAEALIESLNKENKEVD